MVNIMKKIIFHFSSMFKIANGTTKILAKAFDSDNEIETLKGGLMPFGWYGGALPRIFEINTTIYYDTSLLEYFGGSDRDVKSWLIRVIEFAKIKMIQPSLKVGLKLEVNCHVLRNGKNFQLFRFWIFNQSMLSSLQMRYP